MTRYATPCFSGECGFCPNCCKSDYIHKEKNEVTRSKDMKLLYGRKKVDEISNDYTKRLNNWCKQRGYKNPNDIGWTKQTVKKFRPGSFDPICFSLIRSSHKYICSDPHCQLLHEDANDWLKNKSYPIMPIYSWKDGEKSIEKYICGPCLDYKCEL